MKILICLRSFPDFHVCAWGFQPWGSRQPSTAYSALRCPLLPSRGSDPACDIITALLSSGQALICPVTFISGTSSISSPFLGFGKIPGLLASLLQAGLPLPLRPHPTGALESAGRVSKVQMSSCSSALPAVPWLGPHTALVSRVCPAVGAAC